MSRLLQRLFFRRLRQILLRPRHACGRPCAVPGTRPTPRPPTSSVPMPPTTAAGAAPIRLATRPLSKLPSWFEAPTKIDDTALTRPRISSGVAICTSVCRTTTITMSQPPSAISARTTARNPATARTRCRDPEARDRRQHHRAGVAADRQLRQRHADRSGRRASGPSAARRARRARHAGYRAQKSATARSTPPSSTANRSSEIAPSTMRLART